NPLYPVPVRASVGLDSESSNGHGRADLQTREHSEGAQLPFYFPLRIASKLLRGSAALALNSSNASSRSSRSHTLMPSTVIAFGKRPLSTSSRNLVFPIPR